jgi:hypothetical protein
MRRRFLFATVGLAVAMLLLSSVASSQTVPGDSVVGDGGASGCPFLQIDARSGPSGENPSGTAEWACGGGSGPNWQVDVTCLSVTGNTAVIGFSGSIPDIGPFRVAGLIRVVDAGGPASGLDTFEWAEERGELLGEPLPGPTDCSSYPSSFPTVFRLQHVIRGDIVVIDARPSPTAKDQCKNGGWQTFGVFRNQGDCVSFVATGGKNPPAGAAS